MMTNAELARRPAGALGVSPTQTDWTPDQRSALDALGIDDSVGAGDLKVFLSYAQRTGLDPFARQIYLIGRYEKSTGRKRWTIQTGIDGFYVVAKRSGLYRGMVQTLWCGPNGKWREPWLSAEPPAAAKTGVRHADYPEPLYATALWSEYAPLNRAGLWNQYPARMLEKCAEALALRKAFPNDLSGMYTTDEMSRNNAEAPALGAVGPPPFTLSEIVAQAVVAQTTAELQAVWRAAGSTMLSEETVTDEQTGEVMSLGDWLMALQGRLTEPDEDDGSVPT
jgi:phage recombination protein Bet